MSKFTFKLRIGYPDHETTFPAKRYGLFMALKTIISMYLHFNPNVNYSLIIKSERGRK